MNTALASCERSAEFLFWFFFSFLTLFHLHSFTPYFTASVCWPHAQIEGSGTPIYQPGDRILEADEELYMWIGPHGPTVVAKPLVY